MTMKRAAFAVTGLFILLYILPLGMRPLVVPDEFRYAEIPREMLASGNWVVPRLNGLRYFEKPVMGYWVNAISMYLFGENAFALRLPAAVSAGISALIVFMLAQTFSGVSGIFSAIVFLTSVEVFGIGTFAVLDSVFSMFVTAMLGLFFCAYMAKEPKKKTVFLALCGLCCGFAFLTKGFLAFVLPFTVIIPFMLWERRGKEVFKISLIPIITSALVILPWALMIHAAENDFWHYFFWIEHIKRFMADDAQHLEPFWYFIPALLVGGLPWAAVFPAIFSGLKKINFQKPLVRFVICWFIFPFLFFSVSKGKLATYILPCFPPLAVIISMGLFEYFKLNKEKAFRVGALIIAGIMILLATGLVVNQVTGFPGIRLFAADEIWKLIFGLAALLSWGVFSIIAVKNPNIKKRLLYYSAAPLLLMLSSHFIMPAQVNNNIAPGNFLLRQLPRIKPDSIIVTDIYMTHPAGWTYKKDNFYLLQDSGELSYGVTYDEKARQRLLTFDQFNQLIKNDVAKRDIILITKTKFYKRNKHLFTKPTFENTVGNFVFAVFEIE